MGNTYTVTVLTTTYNRLHTLPELYGSLCNQTNKTFQWLVIDDGSTDGTDEWFSSLPETEFEKKYYKKKNGGKHTALNYAHPYIGGELTFIVDSDDRLSKNAIDIILEKWKKYKDDEEICGMTFLKGHDVYTPIGNVYFLQNEYIASSIEAKVNSKKCVDSSEVIRTSVLKEFPFPEFKDEKFMAESYLWNLSGYKYKTVYFNYIIYVCEYLSEGLTDKGKPLRIRCPRGGMENSKTYFDKRVCLKQRIKNMWLYICYGQFAGIKLRHLIKDTDYQISVVLHYPFGKILYWYWKKRYFVENIQ